MYNDITACGGGLHNKNVHQPPQALYAVYLFLNTQITIRHTHHSTPSNNHNIKHFKHILTQQKQQSPHTLPAFLDLFFTLLCSLSTRHYYVNQYQPLKSLSTTINSKHTLTPHTTPYFTLIQNPKIIQKITYTNRPKFTKKYPKFHGNFTEQHEIISIQPQIQTT